MEETKTGVVDVVDVEEKTMEKLLEFIYSGKFEIHGLINLCKGALSQKDVTPKNATGILLLADRHSLHELKKRVVAWILAEKEVYMADKTFTKEIEKHPALLMDLLKT